MGHAGRSHRQASLPQHVRDHHEDRITHGVTDVVGGGPPKRGGARRVGQAMGPGQETEAG